MRREFLHLLPLLRIPHRVWAGARLVAMVMSLVLGVLAASAVQAQGVELKVLKTERRDGPSGELTLDFNTRITLGPAIEDALQRGVPLYFVAQASVYRNRWYWRDERLARVNRAWRLAYQPLTANWRLSMGGLSQSFATLTEAMAPLSRVSGWRLLDADKLDAGERYYVEFSFKLDSSQLPQPMQIDLGGDWKLGIERSLRVD
jgi:hypothetical protein